MNRRLLILLAIVLALVVGILLLSYEIIGVEFADLMEDQESIAAQDPPRLLPPEGALSFGRPAYLDDPQSVVNPVPADEVSLQRGGVLFSLHCAVCHGAGGRGDGPVTRYWQGGLRRPPNLTEDYVKAFPDGTMYQIVTQGIGNMPPLRENLSERQRWDLINYVRSMQP